MIHRLVVLPDYQGIGLGTRLASWVGVYYTAQKYHLRIITSQPALMTAFKRDGRWRCYFLGRQHAPSITGTTGRTRKNASSSRLTSSWEFVEK